MAKYFRHFPKTFYSLDENSDGLDTVTNVIARFKIADGLIENTNIFYPYDVKDTDTPEIIADKIYGSVERHWVVLSLNKIVDPQWDWPLQENNFINFVNKKYTANGANDTQNLSSTSANAGITTITAANGSLTIPFKQIAANNLITSPAAQPKLAFNDRISLDGGLSFINVSSANTTHITLQTAVTSAVSNNTLIFKNTPKTGIRWAQDESNIKKYFKVVTRTVTACASNRNSKSRTVQVEKLEVDANTFADLTLGTTFDDKVPDGTSVLEVVTAETQSYYGYEFDENEKKRKIKLLRPEFALDLEKSFKRVFK